ncbi:glycosyltransferase family 2 protein [Weissella paramesenteroides]|uniref:glycosyltransferase family 2 protein n=1 Tax=Weissella paramesenteroides TaxID=1249 RepID=UPI003F1E5B2D
MYKVVVLMSSYNGEKYISEQIESILNQVNVNVHLFIRDDGSTDDTLKIIKQFKDKITIFYGENIGLQDSFGSLIWNDSIDADFYAFSDQDDVWDKDKLFRAVTELSKIANVGMYASNQRVVDADLHFIKPLYGLETQGLPYPKYKNFKSFFLNNNYFGNTIVLNRKAMEAVREYRPNHLIVQHDTWVSIVVYINGQIIFDSNMHSSYRQHNQNVVGGLAVSTSLLHKVKTFKNKRPTYSRLARLVLEGYSKQVSKTNVDWLNTIVLLPNINSKLKLFFDGGIRGKNLYQTVILKMLILSSKF